MKKRDDIPAVYYEGRSERGRGAAKLACPYSPISVKGGWWLAGWNDMDMEIESGHAAPRAA